jgi:uncharacterized protein
LKNFDTASDSNNPLIKALLTAEAYPHPVAEIQLIETHISWVILTGNYVYKIKKAVNFGFLDFSTLEKRFFYCQEEVRLNQRLAKDWYLGVVPISGHPENPKIAGAGQAIEYAVKMAQFPSALTLRELAEKDQLKVSEIDQIAEIIADFHGSVEKAEVQSPYGESQEIRHWCSENFIHIRPLLENKDQLSQLDGIEAWLKDEWTAKAAFMQQRKQQGFVREGHGDLHLGNMSLINGKVVLFDCIEFNPMLRWIDVISEVAFLFMDLLHLNYYDYAFRFINRYLQETGDYEGLVLLRYYLVYRALVRAKVVLLRIKQNPDNETSQQILNDYRAYAGLAEQFTKKSRVEMIITHGFSGSGKSTYAAQLAEKISAIQIRSDIERKRLFGYLADVKTVSDIDTGLYTAEAGQKTYAHLVSLAKAVLESGFTVIVDAAFLKREQRDLFRRLANDVNIEFTIIDFRASEAVLRQRVQQRQNDPSEATIAVLNRQLQTAQGLSEDEKGQTLTVNTESDNVLEILLAAFPKTKN